jgi:two-component system phosphate regulon response regulator PhoB
MENASSPLVLIVDDEPAQLEVLSYNLGSQGFRLEQARDGEEALLVAEEVLPDLIILDWMLPNISGIEVCRRLKSKRETKHIPIIMLTARGEEGDRVRGLTIGSDDYMVKPYSVEELIARAHAMLRRTRPSTVGVVLEYEDIRLNAEQHRVTRAGSKVQLGPTEYKLLCRFMENPKRVWTREQLLDWVWGQDSDVDLRTVDVHVGRLRKTLNRNGGADLIRTVRGTGYSLDLER